MSLKEIAEPIQQIAEAIAAVLKLEVTVVDENLERVAGTGEYRSLVGQFVPQGSAFDRVLATGEMAVVTQPRASEFCTQCSNRDGCVEAAHVCCPIQANGRVIGVIGLIAFDEEQRRRLLLERQCYLDFAARMSELIESKIQELETLRQLVRAGEQLRGIVESVHDGILAIDDSGRVICCNSAAERILQISRERLVGRHLGEVVPRAPLLEVLRTGKGFANREVMLETDGRTLHHITSATPIFQRGRLIGAVAVLKDIREVRQMVYEMTGDQPHWNFESIIGDSPALREVKEKAKRAAASNSTVLITGESGTGKELFARAIHAYSPRRNGPFIAINCGAVPETLLESELFGYEEGAFTGARRGGKPGKFELADGGTIFLDEVGDMSLRLQVKLLRVLEEGRIERVGGTRGVKLDVRVIAATHRDLEQMLARSEFREDLYYRLNVIPLHIPPLRERPEDIPLLLDHFVEKHSRMLGKVVRAVSQEARRILLSYPWPGNVRELENAVEYAVNMLTGDVITPSHLPDRLRHLPRHHRDEARIIPLQEMEKEAIRRGLEILGRSDRAKVELARRLGISRATIYRKIKKYGLG